MKKFWKKQKQNVFIIGLPLIMVGFVFFLIIPQMKEIDLQINETQKVIANHDAREKKIAEIEKMRQQYALIDENKGNVGVLFSPDKIVEVIEKIEKMAEETDNEIAIEIDDKKNDVSVKKTEKSKSDKILQPALENYITVRIRLTGSYRNLVNFVNKVENFDYYADIFSIQITTEEPANISQINSRINPFVGGESSENKSEVKKITNDQGERIIFSNLELLFYEN
ncbi:MAG: hypothetical protein M0P97_03495 [Candidatus Moranbacteria bacterium]|jgi:Tfp pilus assembly protein PilO|nr:hypothetical protein [Candidatus Moranbacteria bacterium]